VLWERHKIARLSDDGLRGSEQDTVRRQIIEIALKYHLVSRYTSLVAVDVTPSRPDGHGVKSHALKTNLPHGWDYDRVFGLPQTATPAQLNLVVGMVCVLLGLSLLWSCRGHAT